MSLIRSELCQVALRNLESNSWPTNKICSLDSHWISLKVVVGHLELKISPHSNHWRHIRPAMGPRNPFISHNVDLRVRKYSAEEKLRCVSWSRQQHDHLVIPVAIQGGKEDPLFICFPTLMDSARGNQEGVSYELERGVTQAQFTMVVKSPLSFSVVPGISSSQLFVVQIKNKATMVVNDSTHKFLTENETRESLQTSQATKCKTSWPLRHFFAFLMRLEPQERQAELSTETQHLRKLSFHRKPTR